MKNIPLVSVIIPAFNASKTLHQTLVSVSSQTYSDIEIIVVDDGSVDDTLTVVRAYIEIDPRVRCIEKANGGVASARNAGAKASQGEFLAFIDADDLWHPSRTAKGVAALLAGGDDTALVYSPYRRIDNNDMVMDSSTSHGVEGWVVNRHFHVNLIGNGSAIMVRRNAFEALGGYSSVLHEAGAQGCEDLLLQLRFSLHYRFGFVPEYLVGYRESAGNMSSNNEQMLRSGVIMMTIALAECPGFPELAERGLFGWYAWEYLKETLRSRHLRQAMSILLPRLKGKFFTVVKAAWNDVIAKVIRLPRRARNFLSRYFGFTVRPARRHFYEYDPARRKFPGDLEESNGDGTTVALLRTLCALAAYDADYCPEKYFPGSAQVSPAVVSEGVSATAYPVRAVLSPKEKHD